MKKTNSFIKQNVMNTFIEKGTSLYPSKLQHFLGKQTPRVISTLGNLDILQHKLLAIFCSVKCPGTLIIQTYDFAQSLKEKEITVIGGFHSPIEQECLRIFLRGNQPIILCPARSINGMRIRAEYKKPLEEGRLLFLSLFTDKQRRVTADTALLRNYFVAALADSVFIAYAAPHSKTEWFCQEIVTWGKSLYAFTNECNANLIKLGAQSLNSRL
ncbi:MAG: DNA-processing protein DprA [Proteobacteria bacterium]|nr:DNA-processing protein DprA [Pseudomonadota bacterium]